MERSTANTKRMLKKRKIWEIIEMFRNGDLTGGGGTEKTIFNRNEVKDVVFFG
jgi:hypothetical protein